MLHRPDELARRPAQIRLAAEEELEEIRTIERSAGTLFAQIGMDSIAEEEPMAVDELREYQRAGRAWVATNDHGVPVAYVLFRPLDGVLYT